MEKDRKGEWYLISHMTRVSCTHLCVMTEEWSEPERVTSLTEEQIGKLDHLSEAERSCISEVLSARKRLLEEMEGLGQKGIRYVCLEEPEYPALLRQLPDRPAGLFVKGELPKPGRVCVAIVGARACSDYGRSNADYFGETLSGAGMCIVSGLASGIDGAAQGGAVRETGGSVGVLAGGVDICYPRENRELYDRLVLTPGCGVIGELPPGTPHLGYYFPRRNRIISGMCEAVVVVEARKKSGSLLTAEYAADQGRTVYAIPGDIRSHLSDGCHQLIRNGGILLSSPAELLEDLKMPVEAEAVKEFARGTAVLGCREEDVYRLMGNTSAHVEELLRKSGYPAGDLMSALLHLELYGYAVQEPKNYYRRTRLLPPGF